MACCKTDVSMREERCATARVRAAEWMPRPPIGGGRQAKTHCRSPKPGPSCATMRRSSSRCKRSKAAAPMSRCLRAGYNEGNM